MAMLTSCRKSIDVTKPKECVPYIMKLPEDTKLTEQRVTVRRRSPGAIGIMPDHINYKYPYVMGMSITVLTDFGAWKNLYIYEDDMHKISGIADGAETLNRFGKTVARARISTIVKGRGVEVDEYHYSGERITFYCKSFYNFGGDKTSERNVKGSRIRDYYPIWPTSGRF